MDQRVPRVGILVDATYRLDALLGEGGTGAVFRATHLGLQKPFALKVLVPPPGATARFFERFRVEAEALGRLDHPGIVRVTDFGVDPRGDGLPYLVMELLEGPTLDERCSRGPLPLAVATPYLEEVAEALDAAHAAGVAHGDLTLRNVMLTSDGGTGHAVVIDFGLARVMAEGDPSAAMDRTYLAGTAAYMAPEIHTGGAPSSASDLYAFGVLAYRVLTGRHPFVGSRSEVLRAHVRDVPLPPSSVAPGLPLAVDAIVLQALNKVPDGRPRSATDIGRALASVTRRRARAEWLRREVPRRVAAGMLVAAAVTALQPALGSLGFLRRAESASFDARIRWSSPRTPDPRLLLVSLDDRSLASDNTPLPDRADEVGSRLTQVMSAGASVLGVDLLMPTHWGESRAFADLVLRHAPQLALAVAQDGHANVGPEAIGGLIAAALGPTPARGLFASVNVEPDLDGVVRSARVYRVADDGSRQPTMAARLAGWPGRTDLATSDEPFPIDYRLDRGAVERISWVDLDERLRDSPGAFARRLILVGAEFAGSGDRHLAPAPGGPPTDVTGLEQQALVAATLLAPNRLSNATGRQEAVALLILILLSTAAAAAALLRVGPSGLLATAVVMTALWVGGVMLAFADDLLLPVASPVAQVLLASTVAAVWSRRWSLPPQAA